MLSISHITSSVRRSRRRDPPVDDSRLTTAVVVAQPRRVPTSSSASERLAVLDESAAASALLVRRRRQRRLSRNCKNLRRFGFDYAGFRRSESVHELRMADELSVVQQQVVELERRRALLESLHFTRYANARQLAADKIREYYEHFCSGFDPTRSPDRGRLLESIVRSVLLETVQSPAFDSIDQFLQQWANYSRYHAKVTISIQSIQPLEDHDASLDSVVVQCSGVTTFRISRDTIKHFFKPIMNDESLVQQLIGKEYCFPFVTLFHFCTESGRVFRMEPRADLAAGLFNLVSDPFATVKLLGASQLTEEGCLHAYTEREDKAAVVAAAPPPKGASPSSAVPGA